MLSQHCAATDEVECTFWSTFPSCLKNPNSSYHDCHLDTSRSFHSVMNILKQKRLLEYSLDVMNSSLLWVLLYVPCIAEWLIPFVILSYTSRLHFPGFTLNLHVCLLITHSCYVFPQKSLFGACWLIEHITTAISWSNIYL